MKQGDFSQSVEQMVATDDRFTCAVREIGKKLSESDRPALTDLMDSSLSTYKVTKFLRDSGFSIGQTTVWKHRTKQCSCEREK